METPKTGAEDDDMGVVGAEADDAEAEFIRNVNKICRSYYLTN